MKQAADDLTGEAAVALINVDKNRALSRQYEIQSIPTILVLKNGEVISKIRPRSEQDLIAKFRELK